MKYGEVRQNAVKGDAWKWLIAALAVAVGGLVLAMALWQGTLVCPAYRELDCIWHECYAYYVFEGRYPSSLEEMHRECTEGAGGEWCFYDCEPVDRFGNPYGYWILDGAPVIVFWGKDGKAGGIGEDRDWVWPRDREFAKRPPAPSDVGR